MLKLKSQQLPKPLTRIEVVSAAQAVTMASEVDEAVRSIYNKNVSHYRYEVLHRAVYKITVNKHCEKLYGVISDTICEYASLWLNRLLDCSNDLFLMELSSMWSDHLLISSKIKEVMLYPEAHYAPLYKKRSIYDTSLIHFRDIILNNAVLKPRLREDLLRSIAMERAGCITDKDCLRSVLMMMVQLGVYGENIYEDIFEGPFLSSTRAFYQNEIEAYMLENTCNFCLLKIEARVNEEAARCRNRYLPECTHRKLKSVVETELIEKTASALINMENSGVHVMLRDHREAELKLMFSVFYKVPATLEILQGSMSQYISQVGEAIVADTSSTRDHIRFISEVLAFKTKMSSIIEKCFLNEAKFQNMLKVAFDIFLNKDTVATATYIAMYADQQLKSGFRGVSEDGIDQIMQGMVTLLNHVHDKDVFENVYKNLLAKRLLSEKPISDEMEKQLVAKLKKEYGYQFTSKLERMFIDMNLSSNVMHEYTDTVKSTPEYLASGGLDCHFTVLTAGFWPEAKFNDRSVTLPASMAATIKLFTDFYLRKHSGRKMSWQWSLGSGDLRMNLHEKNTHYVLVVSVYQMIILDLFNRVEHVTYADIVNALPIHESELKRQLLSLCSSKCGVLLKSSAAKVSVDPTETFTVNKNFSSKIRRLKVPMISAASFSGSAAGPSSGDVMGEVVPPQVMEERKNMIDSAIVRVMKARKTLCHNDLVAEVINQISSRFSASTQFVKMRIEGLIEREYISRDSTAMNIYTYIA